MPTITSTILCVSLLGLPIVAALALDTGSFAWFLMLFCVAGALTTPEADDVVFLEDGTQRAGRGCEPHRRDTGGESRFA